MRDLDEILGIYESRASAMAPIHAAMRRLASAYNGESDVPIPELDRADGSLVANLLASGLDQTAARMASTMPNIDVPPLKPTKAANRAARDRRQAWFGMWEQNRIHAKQYLRARYYIGYGFSPAAILPSARLGGPSWELRNPLGTYLELTDPTDLAPTKALFGYRRSVAEVQRMFPDVAMPHWGTCTEVELLEYLDDAERTIIAKPVAGHENRPSIFYEVISEDRATPGPFVLARTENRIGQCPVVVPGRISLDRLHGQFDALVGIVQTQSRLMALEVIAMEHAVFPQLWLQGRKDETPSIITVADGVSGTVGEIEGGVLSDISPDPSLAAFQGIDRLERAARITGLIPAEFGGESTSGVRTGRRGDAVLSAAVDYPIREAQEVLADALQKENELAALTDKAYFGNKTKSFYVSYKGAAGEVEYRPKDLWDSTRNIVSYPSAGSDIGSLVIQGTQRVGAETMSRRTFMGIDPMVQDAESEHDTIIAEGLERALLQSVQNQAAQGGIPPHDLAYIAKLVSLDKAELFEAVEKAQTRAQERQASVPETPAEAQPGLAQPGAGAEAAGPAVSVPPASLANLANLMTNVRRVNMPVRGELPEGA
jgi:hypothetical protein